MNHKQADLDLAQALLTHMRAEGITANRTGTRIEVQGAPGVWDHVDILEGEAVNPQNTWLAFSTNLMIKHMPRQ